MDPDPGGPKTCENCGPVPEFIDPVFTKTSPKRSFSLNRKRAFWLVFAKTGSIISGTGEVVIGQMVIKYCFFAYFFTHRR